MKIGEMIYLIDKIESNNNFPYSIKENKQRLDISLFYVTSLLSYVDGFCFQDFDIFELTENNYGVKTDVDLNAIRTPYRPSEDIKDVMCEIVTQINNAPIGMLYSQIGYVTEIDLTYFKEKVKYMINDN